MSALYGSMSGERGEVTKCGHKRLSAHIRGWGVGVRVEAMHGEAGDRFRVYVTSGSNGGGSDVEIGAVILDGHGHPVLIPVEHAEA